MCGIVGNYERSFLKSFIIVIPFEFMLLMQRNVFIKLMQDRCGFVQDSGHTY